MQRQQTPSSIKTLQIRVALLSSWERVYCSACQATRTIHFHMVILLIYHKSVRSIQFGYQAANYISFWTTLCCGAMEHIKSSEENSALSWSTHTSPSSTPTPPTRCHQRLHPHLSFLHTPPTRCHQIPHLLVLWYNTATECVLFDKVFISLQYHTPYCLIGCNCTHLLDDVFSTCMCLSISNVFRQFHSSEL